MTLVLIAALARNRVIGGENRLLWHLPEDLKRFRALTSGHPVVMGRKTFESIGRPLPNRSNLVITRQPGWAAPGVRAFGSLEAALQAARGLPGAEKLFVIGGAEVYAQALPWADRLELTWIDREFEGDAFFPEFNSTEWVESAREEHSGPGELSFAFVTLERRRVATWGSPSQSRSESS